MLGIQNHLTKKQEFEAVKEKGKVIHSESFIFSYYDRKDDKPSRFGFIVSKQVSQLAAVRNKATRSMREGVRQTVSYVKPGYDVVMIAKPIIVRKYTSDLMREVDLILQKQKLLQVK